MGSYHKRDDFTYMDKCARFFHCIRACIDAVARVSEIRTLSSYEYGCRDSKHEIIVFLSIKEFESNAKIKCPHCGSDNAQKKLSEFTAKTSKKS